MAVASRRDELTPEELPPSWTESRAFKDPVANWELLFGGSPRTPCEAAWKVPRYRERVKAWLQDELTRVFILFVQMPDRSTRYAMFIREARLVAGGSYTVARDSLSVTVFAARAPEGGVTWKPAGRKAGNARRT